MENQADPMLAEKIDPVQRTPVITQQPASFLILQNHPTEVKCPFCKADVKTIVKYNNGMITYVACAGLCILGCCCGCCLIPFCINALKDVDHKCPNCHKYLGKYRTFQEKFFK
ncbi:unnamed protein product [Trichobilharzia szidati]|nr:unnamed protein product [Trichobilharzia szidati]